MSIIPACRLSRSDVSRLGNNLGRTRRPAARCGNTFQRRLIRAVNRSLANLEEKIGHLDSTGYPAAKGGDYGY